MENTVDLVCYCLKARKRRKKEDLVKINDFLAENGLDFTGFIGEFINYYDLNPLDNESAQKTFTIDPGSVMKGKSAVTGLIKKGWYGKEQEVVNRKNQKKLKAKLSKDDVARLPFFFLVSVPEDFEYAILILQSYGKFGTKEIFSDAFRGYIYEKHHDYIFEISSISIPEIFQKHIDAASFKSVRIKTHFSSSDRFKTELEGYSSKDFNVSIVLEPKEGKNIFGMNKYFKGHRDDDVSFLDIFKIDGFENQYISTQVTIGGRTRLVKMESPADLGSFIDITSDVNKDSSTGLPDMAQVRQQAIKWLENLQIQLNRRLK